MTFVACRGDLYHAPGISNTLNFVENRSAMKKEVIAIQNLKCGGCVKSIVRLMEEFPEVSEVSVSLEDATVTFTVPDDQQTEKYSLALTHAGYPPEGTDNSAGMKAKSYVSCAIGRMS